MLINRRRTEQRIDRHRELCVRERGAVEHEIEAVAVQFGANRQRPPRGVEGHGLAIGQRGVVLTELQPTIAMAPAAVEHHLTTDADIALSARAFGQDEDLLDAVALALIALDDAASHEVDDVIAERADDGGDWVKRDAR